MKIFYSGQQGGPFGWGTFGAAMAREFKRAGVWAERDSADVIFQPLADNNFTPSAPLGKRNVAMSFFEFALGPDAKANADKFETVFVGSTWCQQRCVEAGIHNTRVLIQGVDGDTFKPQPPREPDGTIRIFSGGKFEYRKGQDLVIAAFREFAEAHPEAHLVCAWHNPWPQLFASMESVPNFPPDWKWRLARDDGQHQLFRRFLIQCGIESSQFTILPQLSQRDLAREMARTDFGLFPNRCEGGNNLVMQEYLATGKLAVANTATGQWDMRCEDILEIPCTKDENHWAVQTVDDIVRSMIHAASDHEPLELPSAWRWTWEAAARTVLDALS
jgi:glycosyltransferase involved in cell wall biosynthesis